MPGCKEKGTARLSAEQQDYVLEMIASETGGSDNIAIIKNLQEMFDITMTSQALQYYRGKRYEELIAKKRNVNDDIIKKKVPLANKLTRVRAFANMHNEIDWRRSGVVHHQGEIIAEFDKKEYGAKIKCLENIREEMEVEGNSPVVNINGEAVEVIVDLGDNGKRRSNGSSSN